MRVNYHTHTYRCKHAIEKEEDYVLKAIKEGVEILGFSDHAPFIFADGFVSHCRMDIDELDDYFNTLLTLKHKYRDYIELHIGFEIEFYPKLQDKTLEVYRKYPVEYFILGEHFVGDESLEYFYAGVATDEEKKLREYVDYCIKALESGRITYVAHPDFINFTGDNDIYISHVERLIKSAKSLDIPLELNMLGIRQGRYYPNNLFWQTVSRIGAEVVLGCDAHKIVDVADKKEFETAMRYADKYKLNVTDSITLKNPIF